MRIKGRCSCRLLPPRALGAFAGLLALALAAGSAPAQSGKGEYLGRWAASGDFGYAIPNTDEFRNATTWRVGAGYSWYPFLEIGLEAGRFTSEVRQPEAEGFPTHDIASGRLEVVPLFLNLRYRAPLAQSMASLVLLAGGGYCFVDYTMADAARAAAGAGGAGLPDQAVRDAFGFHAGAGVEYALSGWFSLTAEGRYLVVAPRVGGTARDGHQLGGTLDLNTWLFTGGIRIAF